MARFKAVGACLAAGAILLAGCGSADSDSSPTAGGTGGNAPDGKPITVGIDEDSTSAGAAYSRRTARAVRDTIAKINSEGGILDRPVEYVVANSESDPTKGAAIARSLIDQGAIALFLTAGSSASIQMKPVLQEEKVLGIGPTSSNPDLIKQPNADYVYTVAPSSASWPPIYCSAFEEMGIESVGVLTENSPTLTAINGFLIDNGISECVEITTTEAADTDATNLTAQAAKIKESSPDAALVSTSGGAFEILAHNSLEQVAPDLQRFTVATLANQPEEWRAANPGTLEGVLALASIDITNERTQEAVEYFKSVNGDDFVITGFDAQGYDAVYLLKKAIEKAGAADDPVAIKDAMNSITDYKPHYGLSGLRLSFAADKHNAPDGSCGYFLAEFTAENTLGEPAEAGQLSC